MWDLRSLKEGVNPGQLQLLTYHDLYESSVNYSCVKTTNSMKLIVVAFHSYKILEITKLELENRLMVIGVKNQ